jgi:4-aminobutyrate aminotransferase and related aminotransferases
MTGQQLINVPDVRTAVPGPKSISILEDQRKYETSTIAYTDSFPFAVKSAKGSVITDVDDNSSLIG